MRHDPDRGLARALLGEVLPGRHAVYFVRCRGGLHLSVGDHPARPEALWPVGNAGVHRNIPRWFLLCMEEGRAGLGRDGKTRELLMALTPAITDLEELKGHPAVARLVAWNASAVEEVKFDREEMTIYVERGSIRDACALLREDSACPFNFLSDITCVDWYPREPRFDVVYHLLSIPKKERVRLKVRLNSASPVVESLTSIWPGANYFEREVFDLFGIRFSGHPYLRRILMPEDWEGYPLRKDYPVEGYR